MHPISRRAFLVAGAVVLVAACSDDDGGNASETTGSTATTAPPSTTGGPTTTAATAMPTSTTTTPPLPSDPFTLGVASGDPDTTSVVLWTRLAPDPLNDGGMPDDDIEVTWEISGTADFATVTQSGSDTAYKVQAHTVHAVVPLAQGDWYYRFRVGEYTSPVGTTRPAPDSTAVLAQSTFAVANCQHYASGQYAAHRDLAEHQPDFVVWLGDYIYEDAGVVGETDITARVHLGPEPTTLDDYRNRYARYKTDAHLQAAHATCPWYVIWDDHEVENNYAGPMPQAAADEPTFGTRIRAAYQAWWEHQPVRLDPPAPEDQEFRIYRAVEWGGLIGLILLDERQYRSDQTCGDITLSTDPACPETFEPARTMLGAEQEAWFLDALGTSTSLWNVIGNQVVLADATFGEAVLNFDQWDGYPVERQRILQHLADAAVPNIVVLTGDIHLAAVAQLRAGDRGSGTPVGVEFITTSISSAGSVDEQLTPVLQSFPNLVDAELAHRGYALHTVTPDRWTAEYRIVTDVSLADSEVTTLGTYVVEVGSNTVAKGRLTA